jgi:hypothetical protein
MVPYRDREQQRLFSSDTWHILEDEPTGNTASTLPSGAGGSFNRCRQERRLLAVKRRCERLSRHDHSFQRYRCLALHKELSVLRDNTRRGKAFLRIQACTGWTREFSRKGFRRTNSFLILCLWFTKTLSFKTRTGCFSCYRQGSFSMQWQINRQILWLLMTGVSEQENFHEYSRFCRGAAPRRTELVKKVWLFLWRR